MDNIQTGKKALKLDGKQVPKALMELHAIMSKWQETCRDLKGSGIQWLYKDPNKGWKQYSDFIANQLEREFQKKGTGDVTLTPDGAGAASHGSGKGMVYSVDFKRWKEVCRGPDWLTIQELDVKRKTLNGKPMSTLEF